MKTFKHILLAAALSLTAPIMGMTTDMPTRSEDVGGVQESKEKPVNKPEVTNVDKAIEFFKAYIYAPSSKMISNNIIEKLEISELLKLIDNKIALVIDRILELNKEAMLIYAKDNNKAKIKSVYVEMSALYESLRSVEFRIKIMYPEKHMQKLFEVLQKIAAQQYKITYNPEADTKNFWDIFTGSNGNDV